MVFEGLATTGGHRRSRLWKVLSCAAPPVASTRACVNPSLHFQRVGLPSLAISWQCNYFHVGVAIAELPSNASGMAFEATLTSAREAKGGH